MKLGVAYYPEYNPREYWEIHLGKIREAGIKRIRMAEFAWVLMQPDEGVFNWELLDESIALAGEYGIEVILGTPTACPPIWLVEKYPEVLPVNKEGRRSGFGARQHRCYNSPMYLKYSEIIVEKLGERYGKHPNVVAWQIDNELGGEQKRCYCNNCRKAFQNFLAEKYHTIEELNERWGNVFWSQQYKEWSQIPVPMRFASDMDMKHHPSLELEFSRFSSNSIVKFSNMQAQILRKYTNMKITTNTDTFLFGDNVNIYELFKELDVGGMDIYSDSLYEIAFYSDITRSLKRDKFWMMEFGTGSSNLYKEMELIRNHGCEWFTLFTFTPFLAGQEQGFKGLLTITGEKEPNYYLVKKWSENHNSQNNSFIKPGESPIGLYYDFDSSWSYWIGTWSQDMINKLVYPQYMVHTLYKSIYEENINLDFVFTPDQIKGLKVLILPWQIIYTEALEKALIEFVQTGGKLVVTTDLFTKNSDNVFISKLPEFYKVVLNWRNMDFISENISEDIILHENNFGSGYVCVVKRNCSSEDWKSILKSIC